MIDCVIGFRCVLCDKEQPSDFTGYTCPHCGVTGILDIQYDYERARRSFRRASLAADQRRDLWRYEALLPAPPPMIWPGLPVGGTPLISPVRLRDRLGLPGLQLKMDGLLPTGSLKDRASMVALAQALQRGAATIAGASTGNAASSIAGLAAAVGLQVVIFVPESAPAPKLAQLRTYGAHVMAVRGTYDQAFDLCLSATDRFGWYSRNTGYNPVLSEGKKTVVFEILEQRRWRAPDWIAVSVGDGCILGGIGKGLRDLMGVGLLDRMPRILAVQSSGSAAIYNAFKAGLGSASPVEPDTVADSISVGQPRDSVKALRAVRESGGAVVSVPDEEILETGHRLGSLAGVFSEPAASAALAGVLEARRQGLMQGSEEVVVVITGLGLKDPLRTAQGTPELVSVSPDPAELDAVRQALSAP
ncbi:MAG: threonine synthase [Polyangia bacterium]|jgi:threonine synthase|nr:threonine synthase [Polyangia bacterium]